MECEGILSELLNPGFECCCSQAVYIPRNPERTQNRIYDAHRAYIDVAVGLPGHLSVMVAGTAGHPISVVQLMTRRAVKDLMENYFSEIYALLTDPSLGYMEPAFTHGAPPKLPLIVAVDRFTMADLRMFIPLMIKYSTGRTNPGYGRKSTRPPWWPQDVPWASLKKDTRDPALKQKLSWKEALKRLILSCYSFHKRTVLLNFELQIDVSDL